MYGIRISAGACVLYSSLCVLLLAPDAAADTVRLKNGDVLTGTVEELTDDELVLDTEYADDIRIETKFVESVETEKPFLVRWDDGSEKVGTLEVTPDGKTEVVAPGSLDGSDEVAIADTQEEAEAATAAAVEYAKEAGESGVVAAETGDLDVENVRWIKPIETYYRYEGNLNVGINIARGNTDTTEMHIDGEIAPSFGRNTVTVGGQLNRSEASGVTTASNWRIRAQYDRDFGVRRRWYGAAFNTYENDELADLNLRVTAGVGVGYKFFDQSPTFLRISLGPAYVNENFKTGSDRTFLGLRWALDFEQELWTDDLTLYHTDTMTFGLSETQYVLYTTTGLKVDLIADLSLSAEFQYNYNAEPPEGTGVSDRRLIFKLGYDFGGDENDWWQGW